MRPQAMRTHMEEGMTTTAIPTSQAALPTLIILGVRVSDPVTEGLHANGGCLGATLGTWQGTLHPLIWYAITVVNGALPGVPSCLRSRTMLATVTYPLLLYVAVTQMPLRRWCVERGSLCRLYVARGLL